MKATIEAPEERLVTITMGETEARNLKRILNYGPACKWDGDAFGLLEKLYYTLERMFEECDDQ